VDPELRVDEFDYDLPSELIAQTPLPERDAARLLVVDRASGALHHSTVRELASWLAPGDLVVANNSRVIPARVFARKVETGGRVELLLLRPEDGGAWTALAKPARRLRPGTRLVLLPQLGSDAPPTEVCALDVGTDGQVTIRGIGPKTALEDYGSVPLPPYISGRLEDGERYQTVYGTRPGSAAAPTAGLHFTPTLMASLVDRGIRWAEVTLHVGLDTFRPVTSERVVERRIHREWCSVPASTAALAASTKQRGGRVVAIGTTTARTLEVFAARCGDGDPEGLTTMADLFIVPGYRWRMVDALLTNFHLPRSTLLMMVSAFAGTATIKRAYAEAIAAGYRFYSFGDAMLIR